MSQLDFSAKLAERNLIEAQLASFKKKIVIAPARWADGSVKRRGPSALSLRFYHKFGMRM